VEVGLLIARRCAPASPLNAPVAGGLSLGLAVMYVTALLV
jgi:hypothetical protein